MKKVLSVIIAVSAALVVISLAIAIPITSRPLYYYSIDKFDIEETSEFSRDTVVGAYDSLMDYLHGKAEFSVGSLPYSEEGKSHFEDCKVLFDLDYAVLAASATVLIVCALIAAKLGTHRFFGFSPLFFSGIFVLALFGAVTAVGIINFDLLFEMFHMVFFPGKDNWLFDCVYDPVILILPQEFFALCAVVIVSVILFLSAALIIYGIVTKRCVNENN